MAGTYEDFERKAQEAGLLGQFSERDLAEARSDPSFGMAILGFKQEYAGAGTPEQRLLINEAANQYRMSRANYHGGTDGSKDILTGPTEIDRVTEQIGAYGPFNYQNNDMYQRALEGLAQRAPFSYDAAAPVYNNAYAQEQQRRLDAVLNRPEFSYDKDTDPQWSAYAKQYRREGERATANALAQASAASGGRPSSYAATAASQAGDYYASQLSDALPQLYQQAYQRYLQDYQMKLSDLNAVNTQEQLDYNRYLTDLGQFNTDRNFALSAYEAEGAQQQAALNALANDRAQAYREYQGGYDMLQNHLNNLTAQDATEYQRYLDRVALRQEEQRYNAELAQKQVNAILAANGTPGSELLGRSGYSGEYADIMAAEAQRQMALEQEALRRQLNDRMAGYGDFTGIAGEGIDTAYLAALQQAELAAAQNAGLRSGSPSTGPTMTVEEAVAAFENGDHSAGVIAALMKGGYTFSDLAAALSGGGGGGDAEAQEQPQYAAAAYYERVLAEMQKRGESQERMAAFIMANVLPQDRTRLGRQYGLVGVR